ncbi:hypothetical protein C358_06418 [Cryptococcus neoformans MW-RSA852]|nr:hypothetical protein C356_06405 [Cryptococcus neoformans var. grubii c45]OXC58141.1 hypothetical protein C358_06418 [Cryptococcus neoformans var. grubii MW-RSA852]
MPRDLGQLAQDFRESWLAPSGGWLSEITIIVSDVTGVWDIIVLSGFFVAGWIVIRTSPMEISMILALAFDLAIPLQYQNNDYLKRKHERHLENYWPTLVMGCLIEGVAFFLLHPDLFTLVVCLKTSVLTVMWMSQGQGALPIKVRSRSSESSKPSKDGSSKSSSSKSKSISQPRSRSSKPPDPPIPADMPISIHVSNPYKYLHRAGYADSAIAGMILALNSVDKEKAKKNMNAWVKGNDKKEVERRNKSYAERARKAGWPGKLGSHGPEVEGGEEGKLKLKIPEDSINKAEEAMRLEEIPAEERKKVLSLLKNPKSESEIQMAAKILERMGIPVEGSKKNSTQEIRGGSSSKPESKVKHKFGESDGQGGYRDIQLSNGTVRNLAKGMMVRGWSEADINQWCAYLQRPFSRREVETKVIPLAKSVNVYLGGGYTGGGPHRFDTKKLQAFKTQLRDKCGVDNNFAEHMMLVAINQPTAKESQGLFNRWLTNGLSRAEFDQLRKTGPDWA